MPKVDVVSLAIQPRLRLTLVASSPLTTGEAIFQCAESEIVSTRTWRTIQLDAQRHVRNELLDYVEHSCEPNAVFDGDRLAMVAIRNIAAGEPITFFYPGSEVELAQAFDCHCGSRLCIGEVRGAFYLTAEQMRQALEAGYCTAFMAAHVRRLLQLPIRG